MTGAEPAELAALLDRAPDLVVLEIVGLSVYDFFAEETGCHLWQSLQSAPEVVRVRVSSAPPDRTPRDVVAEHAAAVRRFQEALEAGRAELPENPEGFLPAVRRIRFDPPARPGATAMLELEDYLVGTSSATHARGLAEPLRQLWLLRMSRQEGA